MAIHLKKFPQPEKLPPESILKLNLIAGGAIASSLVLWSLPPFLLARNDNLHRWLQALSLGGAIASSSIALVIGYKLKKVEPILHAETKQEVEDYQHWLASSRYYSEAVRETIIAAALEGEAEEEKAPLPPFSEPAATPYTVFEERTPQVPPTPPKTRPTPKTPITPPAPPPVSPTVSETYSEPFSPGYSPAPPASPPVTNDVSFLAEMSELERSPQRQSEPLIVRDRNDPRFQELWAKIEQPGCEWLQQLLLTKPLLIWGEQCVRLVGIRNF